METAATKKRKLTQEDCDIARFFMKRGMKMKEIGKIIGVDPSTVGKIQKADFRLETYLEQRKEMNRKTAENKRAAWRNKMIMEQLSREAEQDSKIMDKLLKEPEVPGQMKMDLEPEKKDPSHTAQDDMKSMMKFQAAMVDKLTKGMTEAITEMINKLTVLDEIRDALTRGKQ